MCWSTWIGMGSRVSPGRRYLYMSINSQLYLCIVLFLVCITCVQAVLRSSGASRSTCDLTPCLDLYTLAEERLQIENPLSGRRGDQGARSDNTRSRCIALRTFSLCISNMSRSCLGDLGYHSSQKVSEKQMKQLDCSMDGPVFQPPAINEYGEPAGRPSVCTFTPQTSDVTDRGEYERSVCSLFGDPHLERFDGVQETCVITGAWPLIDNDYISIQVTSEPIGSDGGSLITKVTVVMKKNEACALDSYVTYQASAHFSAEPLPLTFDDGLTAFGPADSVSLRVVTPELSHSTDHVAEINLRYIDTRVLIRYHASTSPASHAHLSAAVRIPQEILTAPLRSTIGRSSSRDVDTPLQLCVSGCPKSQQISLTKYFHNTLSRTEVKSSFVTVDEALAACSGLVDYYLDSCVFDVNSSGDISFNQSIRLAFKDLLKLNPSAVSRLKNRTTLVTEDRRNSACNYNALCSIYCLIVIYCMTAIYLINR